MPKATALIENDAISVTDYRCDAGPADVPYTELHRRFSIAYVRRGSFGYRYRGEAHELVAGSVLVGHAGDGNFHLIIMLNPDDPDELATVSAFSERLVERSLRLGGTCSGEHGVGLGKQRYLAREHGAGLDVMRAIKRALDPLDLMNPGKLLPPAE